VNDQNTLGPGPFQISTVSFAVTVNPPSPYVIKSNSIYVINWKSWNNTIALQLMTFRNKSEIINFQMYTEVGQVMITLSGSVLKDWNYTYGGNAMFNNTLKVNASVDNLNNSLSSLIYRPNANYKTDCFTTLYDNITIIIQNKMGDIVNYTVKIAVTIDGAQDTCAGNDEVWEEYHEPHKAMANETMTYTFFGIRASYYEYGFLAALAISTDCLQWAVGGEPRQVQSTDSSQEFTVQFKVSVTGTYFMCYRPSPATTAAVDTTFWMLTAENQTDILPIVNCSSTLPVMNLLCSNCTSAGTGSNTTIVVNTTLSICQTKCLSLLNCTSVDYSNTTKKCVIGTNVTPLQIQNTSFSSWVKYIDPSCTKPFDGVNTCKNWMTMNSLSGCGCYVYDANTGSLHDGSAIYVDFDRDLPIPLNSVEVQSLYSGCCAHNTTAIDRIVYGTNVHFGICTGTI
jgi:hypothetical protein